MLPSKVIISATTVLTNKNKNKGGRNRRSRALFVGFCGSISISSRKTPQKTKTRRVAKHPLLASLFSRFCQETSCFHQNPQKWMRMPIPCLLVVKTVPTPLHQRGANRTAILTVKLTKDRQYLSDLPVVYLVYADRYIIMIMR